MALSFAGNGTITGLSVGGLPDGTVDEDTLANNAVGSGKLASGAGGKIAQVLQSVKNDTFTSTATTPTLITGLSVTITPSATSSKILVSVSVTASNDTGTNNTAFMLQRDSTLLACRGDASGSKQRGTFQTNVSNASWITTGSYTFLDSPSSTSALVYKCMGQAETGTWFVNRSENDLDNSNHVRASSCITVMEISA